MIAEPHAPPMVAPPASRWPSFWVLGLFVVYAAALALIALWPTHVDEPAGPYLSWLSTAFPALTYDRIEFGANVVLFVPFGALLTLWLDRGRYLVLPAALVVSASIELWQSLGDGRTATVQDVVANTLGAAIGLLLAAGFRPLRRRRRR